jgi:peptide/nickel transport system substrate-binding protein
MADRRSSTPGAPDPEASARIVDGPRQLEIALSRRRFLQATGYASVAAFLAACGQAGPSAGSASASASAPPASSAAPATSAAPASSAPASATGTIRVGIDISAEKQQQWLPWHNFGQDYGLQWCAQKLISVGPDGTQIMDMAEKMDVSPDGKTYTFTLRKGNKWHDGQPVTADDVAFTFNTLLKEKAGSTRSGILPVEGADVVKADNTKDASGIQVVDPNTIKFVLTAPNNAILDGAFGAFAATFIAPKHAFEGKALEEYVNLPVANLFIGSGPYKMVQNEPKQFVNYEAYPEYINGTPGAAKVSIKLYADGNSLILGTQAGEIDLMYIRAASTDTIAKFDQVSSMTRLPQKVGVNISAEMNQRPHLKDIRVRQAFLYALDRDALAQVRGAGVENNTVINDWFAFGLAPDLNTYAFDKEKAKSLLQAAGWDPNKEVDVKWDGPATGVDELPIMQQMWADVGIKTKFTRVDSAQLIKVLFEDMDYDLYVNVSNGQLGGSPWAADLSMGCDMKYPAGYNGWGYCNPKWDENYKAAVAATDTASRDAALAAASKIFNDELPYLPYFQRLDQAMVSKTLKGPEQSKLLHPLAGGNKYWEWSISG